MWRNVHAKRVRLFIRGKSKAGWTFIAKRGLGLEDRRTELPIAHLLCDIRHRRLAEAKKSFYSFVLVLDQIESQWCAANQFRIS